MLQKAHTMGFYCTQASLEAEKKELEDINKVQLPEVMKEIAEAREKGDLSENSEYQYGKDKQQLLQKKAQMLAQQINNMHVLTPESIDPATSGFGTVITVKNVKHAKLETYTLMGPWESDDERGVINILAPIGKALAGHKKGDHFVFEWAGSRTSYIVEDVHLADFQ